MVNIKMTAHILLNKYFERYRYIFYKNSGRKKSKKKIKNRKNILHD